MLSRATLLTLLLALAAPLCAQTTGTGRFSGRVTGAGGDALPGVTVTLEGGSTTVAAVTDANGRFSIETFVDGSLSYRLRATLPGFRDATRNGVRATTGATTVVPDIALRLGCADIDLTVNRGFTVEAASAALVAHLRIEAVAAPREWQGEYGCVIARAAAAFVVADERGAPQRWIDILVPPRYEGSNEVVLALAWDLVAKRYTAFADGLRVTNGIATLDEASIRLGLDSEMPVHELLELLAPLKVPTSR